MSPHGVRSVVLGVAIAASACGLAVDRVLEPTACARPVITRAAIAQNTTNVLSMFAMANVSHADSVVVRFGVTAAMDSVTPAFATSRDSVVALVLGLLPSTEYKAQLLAFNSCGSSLSETLPFATKALPLDLPAYTAAGADPSPGFVVFAAGSYGLVIDNGGRVVWYHHFPNGPGLNFQAQPNGRYAARPSAAAGEAASWVEIAPDGNVARTLGCAHDYPARMHDVIAQTDGSYWLLCDETRTMDLSAQGESPVARVLGTNVQHRSVNGDLLFEWSPFDHFDVDVSILQLADRVTPVINWTHGNALDLDRDGNLLVSFRNLSEVTKVDTRTGAVVWRMGGKRNQFAFDDVAAPAFAGQHGLRATGIGQFTVLDNLGEQLGSRAERYQVDEARRVAHMSGSYRSAAGLVAQIGGSTQSLADGHTLVSYGNADGVEEYDASGTLAWRILGAPGYIFRAQRIHSLYRPGVGDPR